MNLPLRLFSILFLINCTVCFSAPLISDGQSVSAKYTPKNNRDSSIVVIPFAYKQSALYHAFTLQVMDSVINILLKDTAVTLSIEGYTHMDEGSDAIAYYLSLNRAIFIKDYVLGRGVDSSRIVSVKGLGKARPVYNGVNKQGIIRNCRAEVRLNYPLPPAAIVVADQDEDGIPDAVDDCPTVFGEKAFKGCPNKDAVIIPFETQQSSLNASGFKILDSVVNMMKKDPALVVAIEGHAYKTEGIRSVCDAISKDRADIVKGYLLSRYIAGTRIESVKSFGNQRPLNAGKNSREVISNSRTEIILIHH